MKPKEAQWETMMQAEDLGERVEARIQDRSPNKSQARGGGKTIQEEANRAGDLPEHRWADGRAEEHGVEPFVTRAELARIMRVSIGTIDEMVRKGMPSVVWGKRCRRFRASIAIAWAEEARAA